MKRTVHHATSFAEPIFMLSCMPRFHSIVATCLLGQRLSIQRWMAVLLLSIGVLLVLLHPDDPGNQFASRERRPFVGFMAVGVCSLCSAFSGVWFDKMVNVPFSHRAPPPSLWVANLLVALWALPFAVGMCIYPCHCLPSLD